MKRMIVAIDLFDVILQQHPAKLLYHLFPQVALPALEHMYKGYASGETSEEDFFNELGAQQSVSFYLEKLFQKIVIDNQVIDALEQLSSQVGIAYTASVPNSWVDYFQNLGITHYASHIITSQHAQGLKPHKDFFDAVVEISNLDPKEITVVERVAKNLIVPKQMGMRTVLFAPQDEEDEYQSADVTISNVSDLIRLH